MFFAGIVTFKNNPLWSWISGTSKIYTSTTREFYFNLMFVEFVDF